MLLVAALLLLILFIYLGVKRPGLAVIASLAASLTGIGLYLFLVNTSDYDTLVSVVALVVLIISLPVTVVSMFINSGQVETDYGQSFKNLGKQICCVLGLIILFTVLVWIFGPLGLVFWAVTIGFLIQYKIMTHRADSMDVVSTIGAGMRQNLPLAMVLDSAAANRGDKRANTLREISKWLVQGYSLAEAVKRGYPKCPPNIVATIAAAEKVNQLPQAIRTIEKDLFYKADAKRRIQPVHPSYPLIVLLILTGILFFLMMKIIPVFSQVLLDMSDGEVGLPKSTAFLLAMTSSITENELLLLVLLVVFFVFGSILIHARLRSRRPEKPYLISRISDFIKWHMPIMHWFEFNYSMLRLVGLLRVSLNAGCAVNDAIRNSLGLDVNNCFRKRMSKWLERIEAGEDISSTARQSGMGNTLAWAFDSEVNRGNTPDVLEMLEEFYRSNYSYRVHLALFILEPCIVLMLGVTVGFVIRAIFLPMVTMTQYLAETAMP